LAIFAQAKKNKVIGEHIEVYFSAYGGKESADALMFNRQDLSAVLAHQVVV
jgi:hypothetical protein